MEGSSENEECSWRGCSLSEIYRNLNEWELEHVPPVHPSENHTVLYYFPIKRFDEPPKPLKGHSKWDAFHVRLPCSSKSQYPVTKDDGTLAIESRWEMIEKALLRPIKNSRELEAAILSYNSKYKNIWNFRSLHQLFEKDVNEDEPQVFFDDILPKIIRLALRLPELIPSAIPLLKQDQNRSISLSQQQVSCLLANAFLCTFPRRNTTKKKSEYSMFPDINFNRLFQSTGQHVIEKLKCICNYFRRICNQTPLGVITMTRRCLKSSELPNWGECNAPLGATPLHISSAGTIEDQGKGLLQVDFANKFLGGGVLGSGCVQEEIRFVICPELIVSKLFTEALKPNEALVMIGCERFNNYSGYASLFTWDGNHNDDTPFDTSRRRRCHIVAIDALYFAQSSHQYREDLMLRELYKAYTGFYHSLSTPAPGVASGNWGCGAFGGEATLKALIQLMACAVTKRPLVYFTFGNKELRDAIHNIHTFFVENNVTVKQLWKYLKQFRSHKLLPTDLYSFICHIHRDHQKERSVSANSRLLIADNGKDKTVNIERRKSDPLVNISEFMESDDEIIEMIEMNKKFDVHTNTQSVISCPEINKSVIKENSNKVEKEINNSTAQIESSSSVNSNLAIRRNYPQLNIIRKGPSNSLKPTKSPTKVLGSKKSPLTSPTGKIQLKSTNSNKKSGLRQRSLLEMLDVFYKEKPAKRFCDSGDSSDQN